MWLTPTHKADLLERKRARLKRRKVYNAKPDLPGMCKRNRRFGYPRWRPLYGYLACIIRRRPNRTARHRDRDEPPKRELKPRPPTPKRNPHGYHRERERAEARTIVRETFG